ncbi:PspA/IM30 family protein [Paenibacillus sp. MWE-103]|uniref:PspA/IM30 family protein n=1 Tax=Paenibacillus artemisiicola TaxID=1172618 RepID=A0ABS3WBD7_9BACL|nr:PspA/IM30 family protein [Paenibacillus artemisiicola]MBO7745627.1 PspA/IM30 family protein [Paenibacillus artemisiicola]
MGILNRLFNMTQAAANELLDKLEDPAMMMNQYVRRMQDEIANAQHELLKQEALAKGVQQQAQEAAILAEQSEARALDAMKAGQEAHAREALTAKLHYEEKAREYGAWHENAKRQIAELTIRLESAKAELPQLLKKRDELVNRMQQAAAKSRTSMPSFSVGPNILDGGGASRGFQRMEEKIAQWEAHIEASRGPFGAQGYGAAYGSGSTYAGTPGPSKSSLVDEQLEQLRKKLPTDGE